ncbi:MAG: HAD family hydrolase [Dehalococcoidia bacterium]
MLDSIRAIAFDCYGTLIRFTTPDFIRTMTDIARAQGLDADPEALWDGFVKAALVFRGENVAKPAYRRYDEAWAFQFERAAEQLGFQANGRSAALRLKEELSQADAYEEVAEVLEALQPHYRLAILSNADDDFLHACLTKNGLEFDVVISSEVVQALKPDPVIFAHLAKTLGLEHHQILYVGDHPMPDVVGARRAGVPVAWLNRYRRPLPKDMPAPDLEIASLRDLVATLLGKKSHQA